MSVEDRKAVVRRLVTEVFNEGRLEVLDELCVPERAGRGIHRRWWHGYLGQLLLVHRAGIAGHLGIGHGASWVVVNRWYPFMAHPHLEVS